MSARNYLAITASLVSSERASSSAGITISKRRNQLNTILKCLIRHDSLFRVPEVLVVEDDNTEFATEAPEQDGQLLEKDGSWDIFVDDNPDNYELPINTDA
ncbi:hypothetical protein C8R45DRAFT_1036814 [Mycena sanguinolenta]|nr:hypothetical protein C8R45DRAFT_1036814 [Mycena sanguinolenta]